MKVCLMVTTCSEANCTCEVFLPSEDMLPGVTFTKVCDASYDQVTCCRSHKLILLKNCYIALGCIARALPCVAPRYAVRHELRTRLTSLTYKHLCERPLYKMKMLLLKSVNTQSEFSFHTPVYAYVLYFIIFFNIIIFNKNF